MRLACITHVVGNGGAARSLLHLLRHLPSKISVKVFSCDREKQNIFSDHQIDLSYVRPMPFPLKLVSVPHHWMEYLSWIRRLIYFPEAIKKILEWKPDVVFINGYPNIGYVPFLAAHSRVVLCVRELLVENFLWQNRFVVYLINRFVHHTVFVSKEQERQLLSLGIKGPRSVIYNSNDFAISNFRENGAKEERKKIVVGTFGVINILKGQQLIFDAVLKYRNLFASSGVKFLIYGQPIEALKYQLFLHRERNLEEVIHVAGWTDDIESAMSQIDILLRTDMGGLSWGRDIIEAMSRGIPVVASGHCDEFVKPGVTGELFPVGDIDQMTEHLMVLAKDAGKRLRYGRHALSFARDHFCPVSNTDQFVKRFESLLHSQAISC